MATVEVSTWAQLRSAFQNAQNDTTIKLIADINCNDEIPEGVSSTITMPKCSRVVIDGSYQENNETKNHVIRNLRTSVNSPVTIFKVVMVSATSGATYIHTFKNIDFVNLVLDKPLFGFEDYYTAVSNIYIQNCRFTGKRTDYLIQRYAGQSSSSAQGYVNVYLQKSYFNVPYYGSSESKIALCEYFYAGSSYFYCYTDNCRIRTTYTETYTPTYNAGKVCSEIYNMSLNGCRIEGDIIGNAGDVTYINFNLLGNAPSRTISMQNVYDVNFYISSAVTDKSIDFTANKGLIKKPVKVWNGTTTYTNYNAKTGLIFATESEMKNTDWLIQNGFDVVPSN